VNKVDNRTRPDAKGWYWAAPGVVACSEKSSCSGAEMIGHVRVPGKQMLGEWKGSDIKPSFLQYVFLWEGCIQHHEACGGGKQVWNRRMRMGGRWIGCSCWMPCNSGILGHMKSQAWHANYYASLVLYGVARTCMSGCGAEQEMHPSVSAVAASQAVIVYWRVHSYMGFAAHLSLHTSLSGRLTHACMHGEQYADR